MEGANGKKKGHKKGTQKKRNEYSITQRITDTKKLGVQRMKIDKDLDAAVLIIDTKVLDRRG